MSAIRFAAALRGSLARWAVVWARVWPSSLPIMGKPSPTGPATHPNLQVRVIDEHACFPSMAGASRNRALPEPRTQAAPPASPDRAAAPRSAQPAPPTAACTPAGYAAWKHAHAAHSSHAPNPATLALRRRGFDEAAVHTWSLFWFNHIGTILEFQFTEEALLDFIVNVMSIAIALHFQ